MSPATFVILSGCLTFGAPLALALYELHALRRPPRGPGWSPPPGPPPVPRAPKPLPDCLIPKLPTRTRTRELEDA